LKKEKSCGCIAFDEKNNVLLVRMQHGHWSFPKGHVEPEETEEQTAIRETWEETNIMVKIDEGFREVSTYSPEEDVIKDVVFFVGLVENHDIRIQEAEIRKAEFMNYKVAEAYITYDNDREILHKAWIYWQKKHGISKQPRNH